MSLTVAFLLLITLDVAALPKQGVPLASFLQDVMINIASRTIKPAPRLIRSFCHDKHKVRNVAPLQNVCKKNEPWIKIKAAILY